MNSVLRTLSIFLVLGLLAGCGDDENPVEDNSLSLSDVVGSWIATSAVHTSNADSNLSFDIVANGGEVRMTILSPGNRSRTWVELGTFSDEFDSALTLNGDVVTVDPVEAGRPTRSYTVTLTSGVLTLSADDSEFDFTLSDATPVSTTVVFTLVRNN